MIGQHMETQMHELSVISCLLSLKEPFQISLCGKNWEEANAVLINANTRHALKNIQGNLVTLTLVPERRRGVRIRENFLKTQKIYHLHQCKLAKYRQKFSACLNEKTSCAEAFQIAVDFLDGLLGVIEPAKKPDQRIELVVRYIQENLAETISAKKLARLIFLSEDRFLHLFKEQLGLPLRQFILYQRMLFATREFLAGKNLTESAHLAGFSDSAHFSRTFFEMNGIQPSKMAKLSHSFDIFYCEHLSWL